jgi:hypothetical protein
MSDPVMSWPTERKLEGKRIGQWEYEPAVKVCAYLSLVPLSSPDIDTDSGPGLRSLLYPDKPSLTNGRVFIPPYVVVPFVFALSYTFAGET